MAQTSRRVAASAISSALQVIISAGLYFVLYRKLLAVIGQKQVGIWSIVLASTMAARLTDLGLTASVIKFVAQYRARSDMAQVTSVVSTTATTMAALFGLLIAIAYPAITFVLRWAVPIDSIDAAERLLPIALVALWMNSVAGVYQAALDGLQLIARKNGLLIFGNLLFFACAVESMTAYGLQGLAWAQLIQALLLLVGGVILLMPHVPQLLRPSWSYLTLKELFGYSIKYQISSVAVMLCDPLTKVLMTRFGGLELTALYDMANQMVNKLRALFVSGHAVLVPIVASAAERSRAEVAQAYRTSYLLMVISVGPAIFAAIVALPAISQLWIGSVSVGFLSFALMLLLSYAINLVEVPAHYHNMGTGQLNVNVLAQVGMGVANALLGIWMGGLFGGYGVGLAFCAALVAASLFVLISVHFVEYKLPISELLPIAVRGPFFWAASVFIISVVCLSSVGREKVVEVSIVLCLLQILVSAALVLRLQRVIFPAGLSARSGAI